jgi:monofunctional biosynthetic peptidoglycan transglycosylase
VSGGRASASRAGRAPRAAGRGTHRRGGRLVRWALLCGLAVLLLPAVQVGHVRLFDPPFTGIEVQRRWEAWRGGDPRGAHVARRPVALGEVPDYYLRCVVTAEDSRFLLHRGVDFREVRDATAKAKLTGKPVRGASTITMQCARTLFLWQGRSWARKGLEMYYTFWMELLVPKRRILELYVNHIEMGRGIYGIRAAARHHYSREPWELTKDQLAMLAAILPAPRRWDPNAPTMRLRWRQTMIRVREPALRFPEWGRSADGGR